MKIHTIGIDLGKTSFHLVGLGERGEAVVRKRFTRTQLLRFTANRSVERIGMEACGGSHFLGRALERQGHDVRLIPAQYVKPYVKTNKNDSIDAEAIAEAVGRPTMRFVPIKSDDQLDLQSLHRVRERWIMRRTAVINQMRGLLLERGITVRKGRSHLEAALPGILEDAEANLSGAVRFLLAQLRLELEQTGERIQEADAAIQTTVRENEACRRLVGIPGIGPATATAMIAAIGNGAAFGKGREFAAWMGVVPRQLSTGGKPTLLGISKRGNAYLRRLFVQGARAVLAQKASQGQPISRPQGLAGPAHGAHPSPRGLCGCGSGEQVGQNGLGGAAQRRSLSLSPASRCRIWTLKVFRFPSGLLTNRRWHNGRTRRS
jgi:transposase